MISDDCLLVPVAEMNGFRQFEEGLAAGAPLGALAFYWRNWPVKQEYWVGLTLGEKMFVNHGMYLRSALEQVGWIDEERYQFYHADSDLCLKLWQSGYTVLDCPTAFVEHFVHANRKVRQSNVESEAQDRQHFLARWSAGFADRPGNADCRYRQFEDPHRTAAAFPWQEVVRYRCYTRYLRLRAALGQLYRRWRSQSPRTAA